MGALRDLQDNRIVLRAVAWLLAAYLRLVFATSRITMTGDGVLGPAACGETPFIAVFWHGRFLGPAIIFRSFGKRAQVLISNHRDGEIIARTIQALGYTAIRGSTDRDKRGNVKDKGGTAGLRAMIRSLKEGNTVGITPDGPRGPRMRMSPGALTLAQLSGAPLVPLAWSASRAIAFDSWDRFLLPLPFGRIAIEIGAPVAVPRQLDDGALNALSDKIEHTLNALCASCDSRMGREQVIPAPLPAREHAA